MRTVLTLFLLLAVLVPFACAGEFDPVKDESGSISIDRELTVELADFTYKQVTFSEDTIKAIKQLFGIEQPEEVVEVSVRGEVVANIPTDSKFNGVEVHDVCLQYQYGTDRWYQCEVAI
jgi:hypothetical protein